MCSKALKMLMPLAQEILGPRNPSKGDSQISWEEIYVLDNLPV